jgi:acyl transferase domain-containing protein
VPESATGVALNTIEVRFTGGMLALNRLLMTLQNKRMPVAGFTLGSDTDGMRATILLDCPPESALRYTALISALEDVREAGPAETMEMALIETSRDWREPAEQSGIEAHEDDGTVVASGEPEKVDAFLAALGEDVKDVVRLGPVARPEAGGGV